METARYVLKNRENRYVLARDARAYTLVTKQSLASKFAGDRAEKFVLEHEGHDLRRVKLVKRLKSRVAA